MRQKGAHPIADGLSTLAWRDSPSESLQSLFARGRGFAISFLTLARVASPDSFLVVFFFIERP
jgi:hypothetical protein